MNAIITGGTKGIGFAIAKIFAQNGINLCVCSRSEGDLKIMQESFSNKYPKIDLYVKKCDVSIKKEVQEFGNYAIQKMEKIDILINNAGVFFPGILVEEEEGKLEKMVETNLYSAYHLTRAIVPSMLIQKKGLIINMCSIASKIAYPNGGSYSISKFALLGFSKVLREELMDKGIKVSAILPGATWSNSWSGVELPEERLMQADDIAKVVHNVVQLSDSAVLEEVILRPQKGDL